MRLQIKWIDGWAHAHGTGPDGKRVRCSLKTKDPRQAEEARAHLEARLWRIGIYGPDAVVTFEECALAYANDGGEARYLVKITEALHGMRLRDITPKALREAARRAYPTQKASTVNRQAIVPARAVINYGHAQGWCGPIKVEGFAVDKPKREAVNRQYLDKLRPHLPLRAFAVMLFLHQTGRRVQEALDLRPQDVVDGRAFMADTKNGTDAFATLTPELRQLIAEIEPRHGRIFGYVDRSSLYPTLRRACAKAGVKYLGTHQPGRHSFATELSEAGWGAKAIAEAGGWKTTRMVSETYEHPVAAQDKAAEHFRKKLEGKKLAGKKPKGAQRNDKKG